MSMPVSPVHDININVSNSCNDCCDNDKCSCSCFGKKTPKPSPVSQSAQSAQVVALSQFQDEQKSNVRPIPVKNKKCVIL